MKRVAYLLMALLLAACAQAPTKAPVKTSTTNVQGISLVEMEGGYIDEKAFGPNDPISRLIPWVELNSATGKAGAMGVTLLRVVTNRDIFYNHAVPWLTVTAADALQITVNGKVVVLHAMADGERSHVNRSSGGLTSTIYYEKIRYAASSTQMAQIASGSISKLAAYGQKGGDVWPHSGKDIQPTLSSEINTFYQEQVAPHL